MKIMDCIAKYVEGQKYRYPIFTNDVYEYVKSFIPDVGKGVFNEYINRYAERNADFRRAASNQFVTIGRITGIIRQGVSLRFGIKKYGYFKQQLVNDNVSHFGLLHNDLRTQLDVEHWSIRSGSLQQIISELNIGIEWLN